MIEPHSGQRSCEFRRRVSVQPSPTSGSNATITEGSRPHSLQRSWSVIPPAGRSWPRERLTSRTCPQYRRTRQRTNSAGRGGGPSSSCMALNFSSDHGGALATWRCTQSAMATASSCRRRSARVSWYSSSGTPWATRLDSTLATLRGSGGCRVRSAGLHSNEYRPAWEPRPAHAGDGLASVSFMAKGRELRAPGVAGGQRPPGERRPSCRR